MLTVYIAAPKFMDQLLAELGPRVVDVRDTCVVVEDDLTPMAVGAPLFPSTADCRDGSVLQAASVLPDCRDGSVLQAASALPDCRDGSVLQVAPALPDCRDGSVLQVVPALRDLPVAPAAWAQNVWYDAQWLPVRSINDAARQLKSIQRNWHLHPTGHHRRAALIQDQLPPMRSKPHVFGQPAPTAPLGAWTLWEPDRMLVAPRTQSPFPDGIVNFVENKIDPPGRAYLKLWEVFTLLGVYPQSHELCLDMGSSPGGWSWVLGNLGARVFSVDKAPLDPRVAALPQVTHCLGSGFGFDPRHAGAVDWFFSDMICYPDKLLALVQRWLELGQCRNFVCTLKFQAETDHATARAFAAIPHSRLMHLSCNKHELTWVLLRP